MRENEIDAATSLLVLRKRPGESRLFDLDCARYMRADDTIAMLTDVVAVPRELVTGSSNVTVSSKSHNGTHRVQAKFAGGTDGEDYIVTATFMTAAGDNLAPQVLLRVRS